MQKVLRMIHLLFLSSKEEKMKLKKNNVKRKLAIMFAVLWLFPLTVYADVIPEQTEYIYVNDFAKIMNSQQRKAALKPPS